MFVVLYKELQIQKVGIKAFNKPRDFKVFQKFFGAWATSNKAAIICTITYGRDYNIPTSIELIQTK